MAERHHGSLRAISETGQLIQQGAECVHRLWNSMEASERQQEAADEAQ